MPKLAKAASDPALKEALLAHLKETEGQLERLENVAEILGTTPRGKTCKAMEGLIAEGSEILSEDGDSMVKDLALIIAAQKVEHYEISGYGSAKALASNLELDEVVDLFQATEDEEIEADRNLTVIAEDIIASFQSAGVE